MLRKLSVGAGKASISVPESMFPYPVYHQLAFEANLTELYARAVMLDNGEERFLMMSLDCRPSLGEEARQKLAQALHMKAENIFTLSTHNHSAPRFSVQAYKPAAAAGGYGSVESRPESQTEKPYQYYQLVLEGALQAAKEAAANLRPAYYGYGEGDSYINICRDEKLADGHWAQGQNPRGFSDKTLAVMKFVDEDGRLIAAILNYACHGTCAFSVPDVDGKIKVTAGFAGIACTYIEERYRDDGAVVLWTIGSAGDQNPIFSSEGCPRDYDGAYFGRALQLPKGAQYMIQRYHGQTHAMDAMAVLDRISCRSAAMRISIAATDILLDGQEPVPGTGTNKEMDMAITDRMFDRYYPEQAARGEIPSLDSRTQMRPSGKKVPVRMRLAVLGDMAWVTLNAEIYARMGMKLKLLSPLRHTVVAGHADYNNVGYILSDDSADHDVFQSYGKVWLGNTDGALAEGMLDLFSCVL